MVSFGKFSSICDSAPLPLCSLVERPHLNGPICYSRSIEISGLLVFQPATLAMEFVALIITLVIIYHIKTKYTAVGRKEMVMFFYLYMLETIFEIIVISGFITSGSVLYSYFVAGYYGLISATVFCLLLNGFVGFQFAEDGTAWSVWSIRLTCLVVLSLSYFISIGTFQNIGLSSKNPMILWIWLYVLQGIALVFYSILQIILVVNTLDDLWPIGNIILGLVTFIVGQVLLNILSSNICESMSHYVDGMFFTVICTLLSVMMVYKYWDSITKEDLEFSVNGNVNVWEVKELLDEEQMYEQDHNMSNYGPDKFGYPVTNRSTMNHSIY